MIAFAIGSLLCTTIAVALAVSTDSLLRGWHSYRAQAADLRAIRAAHGAAPVGRPAPAKRMARATAVRPVTVRHASAPKALRAAA